MILYIDACAREASRTRILADALVRRLQEKEPDTVIRRKLYEDRKQLIPLTEEDILRRQRSADRQDYSDPMFRYAKEFAEADRIVIAAPYWDLSFPAILKLYFEHISVNGLTFRYTEQGEPIGLCRAEILYYITTAGGEIGTCNLGYDYVKYLVRGLFGVHDSQCIRAVGLDLQGVNADEVIRNAVVQIREYQ